MADTNFERWATRLSFAARQGSRVAWYAGQGVAMRRMVRRIDKEAPDQRPKIRPPTTPVPNLQRLLRDVAALMKRDLANVEAGLYPMPQDEEGGLAGLLARSRAFFRDVPEVARRRRTGAHQEVHEEAPGNRPRYYLQNFHFQSGGWMTEESAEIYDTQVEVLFNGAANAMRRQALVPLAEAIRGRDQRKMAFADIACGTGSFMAQVRRAFPRLPSLAIDLSEPYVQEAGRRVGRAPRAHGVVAKAESLPLADASLDMASCIYLFHELPPKVRREVAREIGRVIRPGGLFVFVESLQTGDNPAYDGLLELFPQLFHEPYYTSYLGEDLEAIFGEAGFTLESSTNAFFSKVVTFRRAG
ncbi:Ubiquinone/menaquinone biosynthesis C-methylase UbiE [Faunimonas pinastri]|uniref:Ubiquinone/menaquinone biosynthesis C-methylase UbiE n=1 Tax=Faunimonas pinastri TaxID=1855383 RepID=A0A1H8ZYI3_9HYPH|nr:class I SAM-dependent methyltransferase [Faunimonas pinastri]SEP68798.1 Ubiquinone/menaquinone biosynthesis C-methylase UbiE [Faunimonas pinastri]